MQLACPPNPALQGLAARTYEVGLDVQLANSQLSRLGMSPQQAPTQDISGGLCGYLLKAHFPLVYLKALCEKRGSRLFNRLLYISEGFLWINLAAARALG